MLELALTTTDAIPSIGAVRTLSESEAHEREPRAYASLLKLRHSHHEIARLLALGIKVVDVSRMTGFHVTTIGLLQKSPMFNNLVSHYMNERDKEVETMRRKIELAAEDALEELHSRIVSEELEFGDLQKATMGLLDRAGHSPVARSESRVVNISLSDEAIRAIKARAASFEGELTIEGELVVDDNPGQTVPSPAVGEGK